MTLAEAMKRGKRFYRASKGKDTDIGHGGYGWLREEDISADDWEVLVPHLPIVVTKPYLDEIWYTRVISRLKGWKIYEENWEELEIVYRLLNGELNLIE